jgi:hypothetical protein
MYLRYPTTAFLIVTLLIGQGFALAIPNPGDILL